MTDITAEIQLLSKKCNYYDDLEQILWKVFETNKIQKEHYKNVSVGLFNIPCGGFGDIIICKTFYDYIKDWYPGIKVSICSTTPEKYKDLGIDGTIHKLHMKNKSSQTRSIWRD